MRIAFLTSTPLDFARGSGTFAGISTLARASEALGAEITFFTPTVRFPIYTLERLWFNLRIARQDFRGFDAVVGFDMDGWLLSGRRRVPHVASIKGVIADEMRFESGWTRRTMAIQASRERAHVRRADLVMTTSRYAAARIVELYEPATSPRIVPECIDLDGWSGLFRKNPAAPAQARFSVLCVCRLYPRKRIGVLLEAAARLRARIPELEVRIVGRGPEEERLKRLAVSLQANVRWLGDVSQADLAREYQACDLFCLPSVQEGFGIVFLEAMAAAKPIVAARAAAAPEVVTEGLLVEPENGEALAEAIAYLHADPELRKVTGERGRHAVEQYDARRVAGLFLRELAGAVTASPSFGCGAGC